VFGAVTTGKEGVQKIKKVTDFVAAQSCRYRIAQSLKSLTLHTISAKPEPVKRAVITKINFTRQDPSGRRWRPSKDSVIYNVHYKDYQHPEENSSVS